MELQRKVFEPTTVALGRLAALRGHTAHRLDGHAINAESQITSSAQVKRAKDLPAQSHLTDDDRTAAESSNGDHRPAMRVQHLSSNGCLTHDRVSRFLSSHTDSELDDLGAKRVRNKVADTERRGVWRQEPDASTQQDQHPTSMRQVPSETREDTCATLGLGASATQRSPADPR